MKIILNAVLAYENPRGVGRYINNLLYELSETENDIYVIYGKWMSNYSFTKIKKENFHLIELDIPNNKILRNLYLSIILPIKICKYKADLYHVLDTSPNFLKFMPMVSTIHDLAEFEVPEKYGNIQAFLRRIYVRLQIKMSDYIITVSNYTKNDIINRFNIDSNKIYVTYEDTDNKISLPNFRNYKKYFLFVGEIEKTKNVQAIIEAFNLLPKEYKNEYEVRLVGKKGNDFENVINIINKYKLNSKVKFYDYVSEEELFNMYKEAFAFVFPSKFEGFGLPVLEAMRMNIPVICSNKTSIPEVGGDAVLTFDPTCYEHLKNHMLNIILKNELREELILKGEVRASDFSWKFTTEKTLDCYRKVVKK